LYETEKQSIILLLNKTTLLKLLTRAILEDYITLPSLRGTGTLCPPTNACTGP